MHFLLNKAFFVFFRLVDFAGSQGVRLYLWSPVFFGAGIACYFGLKTEPVWTYGIFGTISAGFLLYDCRKLFLAKAAAAGIFLFAAGFAAAQTRTIAVSTPAVKARMKTTLVTGTVEKAEERTGGKGRIVLYPVVIDGMERRLSPLKIRLTVPLPLPAEGSVVAVKALLGPPAAPLSETGYDEAFQLYFRKIGATGKAREALRTIGQAPPSLRRRIKDRIRTVLPNGNGIIAEGLVLGDKSALPERTADAYRTAGIAHLLAVSGLHLGLIAGFVFWIVRSLLSLIPAFALRYSTKKAAATAALSATFFYLLLAGSPVSAVRAFIMISFALSGVFFDRRALSAVSIVWAAMLILAITPEALTSAGFQLSFSAAAALIALSESGVYKKLPVKAVSGVLLTALAASIATAPFAAYFFKRLPVWTLAGNLMTSATAAFWVMPALFVALLLMPAGFDVPFLKFAGVGIDLITAAAVKTASLPRSNLLLPAMPLSGVIAATVGEAWFFLIKGKARLFGLVPFAFAFMTPYMTPRPVMIVSQNLVAIRQSDGSLAFNSGKGGRFVRKALLSANAQDEEVQIKCVLCVAERDGKTIAAARTKKASETACSEKGKYDVLYAKTECGRPFPSRGSEEIYVENGNIRIKRSGATFRPWTPTAR